jgi:hypothetical protein
MGFPIIAEIPPHLILMAHGDAVMGSVYLPLGGLMPVKRLAKQRYKVNQLFTALKILTLRECCCIDLRVPKDGLMLEWQGIIATIRLPLGEISQSKEAVASEYW